VDIVVIGFPPDAPRTGESIPLFIDLVDRGVVRILDVMILEKAADEGEVSAELDVFDGASTGMLGDEDASAAADGMQSGEAAVLICFENKWAAPFVSSVHRNGGRVLAFERVPAQDLLDVVDALEA
jgi:hypothetical protein